jgi:hypothetical protein
MEKYTVFWIFMGVFIASGFIYYFLIPSGPQGKYDNLAKCMTQQGVIMYGREGCHACEIQKNILGSGYQYIHIIDCGQQTQVCMNQRIAVTPTWLINSSFILGYQEPEALANLTGCGI